MTDTYKFESKHCVELLIIVIQLRNYILLSYNNDKSDDNRIGLYKSAFSNYGYFPNQVSEETKLWG